MMKLLLSSLLLTTLCGCLCWSVSLDTLAVIQSPDVSVMEGEMVNITCCWTEKIERVTVRWLKNGTIIKKQIWQNKTQGSLKKDANDCLRLIFPNITRNDSGRYICRVFVDIPIQVDRNGTGTLVTVVALESTDYDSDDHNVDDAVLPEVYIYLVRCLPILFLVTPLCCLFFYLRTKAQKNTPGLTRSNPRSVQRREEDEDEG
ncbi:uncharacterized protein LOC129347231 [Amphiprion ocellaris]|uniref:uncharacterized protein LOC129347231 n=1 Tax=Amphiprion ocellaris TaxID=80972 RepID=UPI000C311461|nr:uncharacterized protein LOC129347231 [Amphiprion ocellaris]